MVNIADSVRIRQPIATLRRDGSRHGAVSSDRCNASPLVMVSLSSSLVLPVRVFRVFQIPKWARATDYRNALEVVLRRWRSCGPLKRPRIPGVISRLFALARRPENIPCQTSNTGDLKDDSNGSDQIQYLPAAPGVVGVDPSGHAQQSRYVHCVEGQVESDEEQRDMPEAELLVQHSPGGLRIPVVDPAKYTEQHAADQHVVKMRHDEVRIGQLPIKRHSGQHNACQAGNQKLKQKCEATEHRQFKADLAAVHRGEPVEDL